tara:strand:- start:2081 stop:2761 length:681 start_codon:yes stop_codon:yes gene_type:complete
MNNIDEKLSALFDGELDSSEIDNVLDAVSSDKRLQKKISYYGLIKSAMSDKSLEVISISSNANKYKFNFWASNSLTAAASILLTLVFINQSDFSRMGEDISAKNKINLAINSEEAKNIINISEGNLVDHVLNVINNPDFMNSNQANLDLRNVGFNKQTNNRQGFTRGVENFTLRVEKKNLGIKKVRNWQHGSKMIYLVPLADGRVLTIYGNIDSKSALEVAQMINN